MRVPSHEFSGQGEAGDQSPMKKWSCNRGRAINFLMLLVGVGFYFLTSHS